MTDAELDSDMIFEQNASAFVVAANFPRYYYCMMSLKTHSLHGNAFNNPESRV